MAAVEKVQGPGLERQQICAPVVWQVWPQISTPVVWQVWPQI